MRIEPHIDYIVLKSESTVEAELLDQWFKREALAAAASYKVGGPCEGLTVTFKKEKSAPTTSQAAVDEFKRLHHNPIVAQLNAELGVKQAEIDALITERNGYGDMCQEYKSEITAKQAEIDAVLRDHRQCEDNLNSVRLSIAKERIRWEKAEAALAAKQAEVDKIEKYTIGVEKDLVAASVELNEELARCAKELGDAGILITEGPRDGIVRLIDERDVLRAEIERLKTTNQELWAALTPEKRHELNLAADCKEESNAETKR